jgi:hypothetical protein
VKKQPRLTRAVEPFKKKKKKKKKINVFVMKYVGEGDNPVLSRRIEDQDIGNILTGFLIYFNFPPPFFLRFLFSCLRS